MLTRFENNSNFFCNFIIVLYCTQLHVPFMYITYY